jgi:hypothetical protein
MNKSFLALCAVLGIATVSSATPLTFFGEDLGAGEYKRLTSHPNADVARTNFLANLVGVGTEDFEGFSAGNTPPGSINFPGAGTATINGNGSVHEVASGTNGVGRYATSGSKYFETGDVFSLAFSNPVAAFGFYGVDIGDFNGHLTVTTSGGLTQVFNVGNAVNSAGGGVLFFGLIDPTSTFTSIQFGNSAAGTDYFGFDDLIIGSLQQIRSDAALDVPTSAALDTPPVDHAPEPSTLFLFGSGLIGLAYWRKKKSA